MPWYEHHMIVEAESAEEMDAMVDRMTDAIGCTDDPSHVCPHFRLSTWRLIPDDE